MIEGAEQMRKKKGLIPEKTVLIEEQSPHVLPETPTPIRRSPEFDLLLGSRLHDLRTITEILLNFENADDTLSGVLALISHSLPLRSAILIDELEGQTRLSIWKAEAVAERWLQEARTHATTAYEYFTRSHSVSQEERKRFRQPNLDLGAEKKLKEDENFIVIPLVVNRTICGVLQVGCRTVFSESDLAFVNAIANQLAIALDRHKAMQREVAARRDAQAAEHRMAFLAESRRRLSSSLDYQAGWRSVAQLVVSEFADVCIVDIVENDRWSADRICALSPSAQEQMKEMEAESALAKVMSRVMQSGKPTTSPDPAVSSPALRLVASTASYACVPLSFEGVAIGALAVARMKSGAIYTHVDVSLLDDLGTCMVMAFNRARMYRTAVEALRRRDDLLGIVAHDLRTPLSVISGYASILLGKAQHGELMNCNPAHIRAIHRSCVQMDRLIEDLVSTASIEAKHLVIERQLNAVSPLIQEVLERMEPSASQRTIRFKTELPDYVSPILVDRERVLQVFANLIGNAIKFAPSGSTVTIKAEQVGSKVRFSIEDAGPGIGEDQLQNIFKQFWRVPGTTQKGAGLGLFIVKGIVEAHGGEVWATKNVGAGSTFSFTLPVGEPRIGN